MRLKLVLVLFAVLILASSVEALCPEIILTKTTYLPGETFQIEIKGSFTKDIYAQDISIIREKDNSKLPLDISVTKISSQKFYAFLDLPQLDIDVSENLVVKLSAYCDNSLKFSSKTFIIKKPIQKYYEEFETQVLGKWQYLTREEHAAALMTLSYNAGKFELAKTSFLTRNCPSNCNLFENSFALIALKQNDYINWINNDMNANGEGCFGDPCEARRTAYALLALKLGNGTINQTSLAWLQNHAVESEEKAILVLLTGQNYNDLISGQSVNGYWLKNNNYDMTTTAIAVFALKSVAEKMNNSQDKTAIENSISKGKSWLLSVFKYANRKERALLLYFAFPKENIESIISVWPGAIKTYTPSSFSLILENNKDIMTSALITIMGSTTAVSIPANSIKQVQFGVPLMTTPDARILYQKINMHYENSYGYSSELEVPLAIFTEQGAESIKPIETNQTNISEEESKIIKGGNLTNETLGNLSSVLNFDLVEITRNVTSGQSISVTLILKNELNEEIKNVIIQESATLINVLSVEPGFFSSIDAEEEKTIIATINPTRTGTYYGTVDASVSINGTKYSSSVKFYIDSLPVQGTQLNLTKNCSELGGKVCGEGESCSVVLQVSKDSFKCCIPAANCKKTAKSSKASLIGIIIFGAIIIAISAVIFLLTRKKQKQMSEILNEAKQKYESKFQRGFPR